MQNVQFLFAYRSQFRRRGKICFQHVRAVVGRHAHGDGMPCGKGFLRKVRAFSRSSEYEEIHFV